MKRVWFFAGWTLVLAGSALAIGFVIYGLMTAWRMGGQAHISVHGWIAMALAFVLTGALGAGLMALAFYSSRRGWDRPAEEGDGDDDQAA